MKQSKWLQNKIQEREAGGLENRRQRAATRRQRTAKLTRDLATADQEPTLLNRLLDEWEEREYGSQS